LTRRREQYPFSLGTGQRVKCAANLGTRVEDVFRTDPGQNRVPFSESDRSQSGSTRQLANRVEKLGYNVILQPKEDAAELIGFRLEQDDFTLLQSLSHMRGLRTIMTIPVLMKRICVPLARAELLFDACYLLEKWHEAAEYLEGVHRVRTHPLATRFQAPGLAADHPFSHRQSASSE
jgi:hypothetical protein